MPKCNAYFATRRERRNLKRSSGRSPECTSGNPFFIEELVQGFFDEGVLTRNGGVRMTRPLGQVRIPPTVQGILSSRIDRLPAEEKGLLQTLAVLGKDIPLNLVRHVTPLPEGELSRIFSHLQAGEFIYERPSSAEAATYTFKHALTQEVAYSSVLLERRKQLHERVGNAIEALYPGAPRSPPGRAGPSLQPQHKPPEGGALPGTGRKPGVSPRRLRRSPSLAEPGARTAQGAARRHGARARGDWP